MQPQDVKMTIDNVKMFMTSAIKSHFPSVVEEECPLMWKYIEKHSV
jgi:hypothetical protein